MEHDPAPVLVGFRYLLLRYGAGRSERAFRVWLYRAIRGGKFPGPLILGDHTRGWRLDEVLAWEAALARVGYAPAPAAPSPEAA
jgi:predicted DNA-binding transcriptional regulator AlpA